MTRVTASRGRSNAVGLRPYYDAVSRPSEVGMEIARPFRALLQWVMNPGSSAQSFGALPRAMGYFIHARRDKLSPIH